MVYSPTGQQAFFVPLPLGRRVVFRPRLDRVRERISVEPGDKYVFVRWGRSSQDLVRPTVAVTLTVTLTVTVAVSLAVAVVVTVVVMETVMVI